MQKFGFFQNMLLLVTIWTLSAPVCLGQSSDSSEPGASAQGQHQLEAVVPKLIRIWGFNAGGLDLGTWDTINDMRRIRWTRVSVNYGDSAATRAYRVTATTDHPTSNFILTNPITAEEIPFEFFFNDQTGRVGQLQMTAGVALTGQTNAMYPLSNDTRNSSVDALARASDIDAVSSGGYSCVVTLIVEPE